MTDDLQPLGRLELHNAFGHEAIRSALEAIDDALHDLIRERRDAGLRAIIEERIVAAWKDYSEWIEASFKAGRQTPAPSPPIHLRSATEICNATLSATGRDVTNDLGAAVGVEVNRALLNLAEGVMNIYRDAIIQAGFDPDGLTPLDRK